LYLWQIRQFPNELQDRLITIVLRCLLILAILPPLTATAQPEKSADSSDTKASPSDFFQKAVAAVHARKSIQARLVEQVTISDQPIRLTGRYLSMGNKLRLELNVKLGGDAEGSLLEVSDGDILWSETIIADARQVTLRNLKQIAAALAEQAPESTATWEVELGLGGLTGLLSSIDRNMTFDQMREDGDGAKRFVIVQAKWKPEVAEQFQRGKDQPFPPYVPDLLRIYFHPETLFPHRFLYLKRNPEKKSYRPLVRLEFQDVELDQAIDETAFQFTQPTDIVPDDITQQYIDQLLRRNVTTDKESQPAAADAKPR
jgi:hypothetical protein